MSKYAIVKIAGKQYIARPKEKIKVDKLAGTAGVDLKLGEVLLAQDGDKVSVGRPFVKGAEVKAEFLGNTRGKKVIGSRYKNKTRNRSKRGHRQTYSEILIKEIKSPSKNA